MEIISYEPKYKEQVLALFDANCPFYFAAEERNDFDYYLDHQLELYFVVLENETVLGCGGINFENETAIISWDMIDPNHHKKGIGSLLLQHRINTIKSLDGMTKIVVRTSQHTDGFYEKNGFTLLEVKKNYWAFGFDLYLMEMEL